MASTYALRVQVESHEYDGEFYLVGDGYGTPADVLDNVAADHLLRIANAPRIEEYLLDVLKHGENCLVLPPSDDSLKRSYCDLPSD